MKSLKILTLLLLTGNIAVAIPPSESFHFTSSSSFRTVSNKSFKAGEELRYRIHYGPIDAGEAIIKIENSTKKVKGRSLLHVIAEGRSLPAFDPVYRVRDRYESYIDKEGLFPWVFARRVNEGGYKIEQDYT